MSIELNKYFDYRDALDAAVSKEDKEAINSIKAELISKYGRDDDDVDTLIKNHT